MDKKLLYKSRNIQSMKNIIKTRDKKLLPIKDNLKLKTKFFNLPKIKSELFTTLMRKNNKKRNNFLTSRNISLSDNEIYNFHSVNDYLYKHRNIRRQILTNPTLSPIDSKEQLTFHNSENDDRGKYKIFSTINTSDNLNNNSKELILSKSSRSLSNSNSSKKKISIGKKDNLKKLKEKKK